MTNIYNVIPTCYKEKKKKNGNKKTSKKGTLQENEI